MRWTRPLLVGALTLAACGTATPSSTAPGSGGSSLDPTTFALQVASSDLATGEASRVQVGVVRSDPEQGVNLLIGGAVDLALRPAEGGAGTATDGQAFYVPAPGTQGDRSGTPTLTSPDIGRGVYELDDVTFDAPGVWVAEASFPLDGTPMDLTAQLTVGTEHALPAPGQPALRTDNLTLADDVDPMAIDSRAQDGAPVPDPELHRDTIAGAIAAGRPALVLFATPVYCQSQFCGPSTDALRSISEDGPRNVDYIHVEIWKDYAKSVVNRAAADWLLRNDDLTEPWLFLIGADGIIVDRWGPLFDVDQVRTELAGL